MVLHSQESLNGNAPPLRSPTPPKEPKPPSPRSAQQRHTRGTTVTLPVAHQDDTLEGLSDVQEIIRVMRARPKLGFLYMTPAVPKGSIHYHPYNLK